MAQRNSSVDVVGNNGKLVARRSSMSIQPPSNNNNLNARQSDVSERRAPQSNRPSKISKISQADSSSNLKRSILFLR